MCYLLAVLFCSVMAPTTAPSADANDRSMTVQEYVDLGVPDPDHAWTLQDYDKAREVLRGIKPEQLPRIGSPHSARLFARMASLENLKPLIKPDRYAPMDERFADCSFAEDVTSLMVLYLDDEELVPEVVSLQRTSLVAIRYACQVEDQLRKEFPRTSPKYEEVITGLDERRDLRSRIIYEMLKTLFTPGYARQQRDLFLQTVDEQLPPILPILTSKWQQRILSNLRYAEENDTDSGLKSRIARVLKQCEKTISK